MVTVATITIYMSNAATPAITRIETFEPADNDEAYLAAFIGCGDCDGSGRREGEAHLTSECYLACTNENCCNGEISIELYGAAAEVAHAAWLAEQAPKHPLPIGTRIRYGRNAGRVISAKPIGSCYSYTTRGDNGGTHHVRSDLRGLQVAS